MSKQMNMIRKASSPEPQFKSSNKMLHKYAENRLSSRGNLYKSLVSKDPQALPTFKHTLIDRRSPASSVSYDDSNVQVAEECDSKTFMNKQLQATSSLKGIIRTSEIGLLSKM